MGRACAHTQLHCATTNDDNDNNLSAFLDAEQSQNTTAMAAVQPHVSVTNHKVGWGVVDEEIPAAINAAMTQLQDPEPIVASTLLPEIVVESAPHPLREQCALFRQICEVDGQHDPLSNTLLQDLYTELQRGQAELQSLMTMIEVEEELIECLALHDLVASTMAIYHRQVELYREAPPVEMPQQTKVDQGEQRELKDLLGYGPSSEGQAVSAQLPQKLAKSKSMQEFEDFFSSNLDISAFDASPAGTPVHVR